jgi:hypothetical protein
MAAAANSCSERYRIIEKMAPWLQSSGGKLPAAENRQRIGNLELDGDCPSKH